MLKARKTAQEPVRLLPARRLPDGVGCALAAPPLHVARTQPCDRRQRRLGRTLDSVLSLACPRWARRQITTMAEHFCWDCGSRQKERPSHGDHRDSRVGGMPLPSCPCAGIGSTLGCRPRGQGAQAPRIGKNPRRCDCVQGSGLRRQGRPAIPDNARRPGQGGADRVEQAAV